MMTTEQNEHGTEDVEVADNLTRILEHLKPSGLAAAFVRAWRITAPNERGKRLAEVWQTHTEGKRANDDRAPH